MEETYISFETAKLAREKGFNEPCCHYYLDGAKEVNNETIMIHDLPYPYNVTDKNYFAVPTQAFLTKWLREKHNIIININLNYNTKCYYFLISDFDKFICQSSTEYKTYEEALERGLQEALCSLGDNNSPSESISKKEIADEEALNLHYCQMYSDIREKDFGVINYSFRHGIEWALQKINKAND